MPKQEKKKKEQEKKTKPAVDRAKMLDNEARQRAAEAFLSVPGGNPLEERIPASELGAPRGPREGSEVSRSSLELMTVVGSTSDNVNEYLEKEAKRRFRKKLGEVSDSQYEAILADRENFFVWMAEQWVDDYVEQRKEEVRIIAEEVVAGIGSERDLYQPDKPRWEDDEPGWVKVRHEPEGKKLSKSKDEVESARRGFDREVSQRKRRLREQVEVLEKEHTGMLAAQRQQLAAQGFDAKMIDSLIVKLDETYKQARQDFESQQTSALGGFVKTGESELANHADELNEAAKDAAYMIKTGTKREMVLAAQRWGGVLKSVSRQNPEVVYLDPETGDLKIHFGSLERKSKDKILDHVDKEVNRVIRAKSDQATEGARKHNLESIFRSEGELDLAWLYVDQLEGEIGALNGVRKKRAVRKLHLMMEYLRKKKSGGVMRHLNNVADYYEDYQDQELNVPLESTFERVKDYVESMRLTEKIDYHQRIYLGRVLKPISKIMQKVPYGAWVNRGTRHSWIGVEGKALIGVFQAIKKIGDSSSLSLGGEWFDIHKHLQANKRNFGLFRDKLTPLIYDIHSAQNDVVSVVSRFAFLPDDLEEDFLNKIFRKERSMLDASARQISIQISRWGRGEKGRSQAWRAIQGLTGKVKSKIEGTDETSTWEGNDPTDFAKKMKKRIERMQYGLEMYSEHLKLLEQIKKKI